MSFNVNWIRLLMNVGAMHDFFHYRAFVLNFLYIEHVLFLVDFHDLILNSLFFLQKGNFKRLRFHYYNINHMNNYIHSCLIIAQNKKNENYIRLIVLHQFSLIRKQGVYLKHPFTWLYFCDRLRSIVDKPIWGIQQILLLEHISSLALLH